MSIVFNSTPAYRHFVVIFWYRLLFVNYDSTYNKQQNNNNATANEKKFFTPH